MVEGDGIERGPAGGPDRLAVRIVDVAERSRFEAFVEGELAGFLDYVRLPGLVTFTHAEVFERYEGKGVGSALARVGLDDAWERAARVLPACPFVADWITRHPEYQHLVQKPTSRRAIR